MATIPHHYLWFFCNVIVFLPVKGLGILLLAIESGVVLWLDWLIKKQQNQGYRASSLYQTATLKRWNVYHKIGANVDSSHISADTQSPSEVDWPMCPI